MSVASEITRLQNAKTSLKTSLNAKNDENHQITTETLEDYSDYVDSIQTSSSVVNGIIEQYKAETSTIDANTFVEFVNKKNMTNTTNSTITSGSGVIGKTSVATINNNKVFVTYRQGDYLYGRICKINNDIITMGEAIRLSVYTNSFDYATVIKIDTDKVFITHYGGNNLYGITCTVNDTTITVGTDTLINSGGGSYMYASPTYIGNNRVFIGHYYANSRLYGVICTIDDTTITVGTDTQLANIDNTAQSTFAIYLGNNNIFIAHLRGTKLYGLLCTINDQNQINPSADIEIGYYYNFATATLINQNKVFVTYTGTNTSLYGKVCIIKNNSIVVGEEKKLTTDYAQGNLPVLIDTDKIFIPFSNVSQNYYLYGIICSVDGTYIDVSPKILLQQRAASYIWATKLSNTKVIVTFVDINYNYVISSLITIDKNTLIPSISKINGLTKTECTTSTAGDVWVLDN